MPLVLIVLLALYLASSGCGDASSEDALTKQDFIAHADHICAHGATSVLDAGPVYKMKHSEVEEAAAVTEVAIPAFEKEIRQIKALRLPNKDRATVKAFVKAFTKAFESGITDLKGDPLDGLRADTNPFLKARSIAAAYGFKACSAYP